ncbi:molybdenum cofactor biosynthesis protein B [Haloarcula quadrata]|uniref:Molybdenum cofactor biosynthesis protein B n=1 Tax=Haloarcula quadrata TaxID=182779 RepID=A0A495R996_9EURY|nr:molybdopterin-binding protein [Haloarcula quadrata]RKS83855.1 molybdenum cofactor biosynthesis protein B [Haloarcula quadrata]
MVDFQSRDTRRGPTDGEDDETDEDETRGDEESAAADTDDEATSSDPAEAADPAAGNDDKAPEEADSTATPVADDTAENSDEPTSKPETDSSVTDRIDEAADHSVGSQSATETQDAETAAEATQRPDEEASAETQSATQPRDTPQEAAVQTTDATPAQTVTQTDAAQEQSVAIAVVTVGTATEEGDPAGEAVETALEATGQTVTARERLRGDYDGIQEAVDRLVGRDDVAVVVTAGGLGVAPAEQTLEAVHPLFEKALPGFEEVYRGLLFEQQGTEVIAIRATAGIADGTPVFCLPADPAAARVAIDEIIAAEAPSLVAELS